MGCWGLDAVRAKQDGDVIFPLRLANLEIYDGDPGEGADVSCRINVREIQHHCVQVDADLVAPDGRLWMRMTGWNNWRFYWPSAAIATHPRMPDRVSSVSRGPPP